MLSLAPDRLGLAFALARPRVTVLITTANADGSTNVAPMNWNTPVSVSPPLLLLAMEHHPKTSDTLRNVHRTGEFVVSLPALPQAEQLVAASYEYPPGTNKFSHLGFQAWPSTQVRPPGIAGARSCLECKVVRILDDLGDHHLVIGEVLAAHYDGAAFAADLTSGAADPAPCVHLGQRRSDTGQTHSFLSVGGVSEVSVPYPPR